MNTVAHGNPVFVFRVMLGHPGGIRIGGLLGGRARPGGGQRRDDKDAGNYGTRMAHGGSIIGNQDSLATEKQCVA